MMRWVLSQWSASALLVLTLLAMTKDHAYAQIGELFKPYVPPRLEPSAPGKETSGAKEDATDFNRKAVELFRERKFSEALPLAQRALEIRERTLNVDHPDLATSLNVLASIYNEQGRHDEAEPLFRRSLAIREKVFGADSMPVAVTLNNIAWLYEVEARYADAEPLYKRSLAIREKALGPDHVDVTIVLDNLAALYEKLRRYADAEPLYKRSLAIREKALGPDHPTMVGALDNLARVYQSQGRFADADPLFQRAGAIRRRALGWDPSIPTATTQPARQPATPKLLPPDDTVRKLGLELGNMSDDLRKRYNIKDTLKGVVITDIHASSPAANQPWRPGNIIIEIADEAVSSVEEFRGKVDRMRKDGQNSALLVVAGADGEQWFVRLSLMP
jgi:tetratricopeptide (TPR) repeat protein